MEQEHAPEDVLFAWNRVLGTSPRIVERFPGRDLWLIRATDSGNFYLKKYGPWRNLPLVDEARLLRYLSGCGIRVAEILPTDDAALFAGNPDELFVLVPELESRPLSAADILTSEEVIGSEVARLHVALNRFPGPIDSYTEDLHGALTGELMLPDSLADLFEPRRDGIVAALEDLPVQLVHGDMTPGNIIMKGTGDVSGFIDFDHLPKGPRIWDIAKYQSRRLRMNWRQNDPTATHARQEHIAPFLHGYQAVSPLGREERATLPGLIVAANVIETSYFMEISAGRLQRRKLPDHDEVLADSMEAAQWQLSHWDQIQTAIQSALNSLN